MIVTARDVRPADDSRIASEVSSVLERRAAIAEPPASLVISDAVALGVAGTFAGPTESGRVMRHFHRRGCIDGHALVAAARFEQGYATPEGHAALFCLIAWVRSRTLSGTGGAATA